MFIFWQKIIIFQKYYFFLKQNIICNKNVEKIIIGDSRPLLESPMHNNSIGYYRSTR